ncbi:MAG: GPW/gp25 family protein [Rikenellaceae bacterium]|nr:GPW/gp25 family protein [Rikenellaceae bacterium]
MSNSTPTQIVRLGVKELTDSIRANIRTILLTVRGEVPFRPGFGLGAERLLGGGMAGIDLVYEVAYQLNRYEKRIRLKQVLQKETTPGHRQVTIRYEIVTTGEQEQITI